MNRSTRWLNVLAAGLAGLSFALSLLHGDWVVAGFAVLLLVVIAAVYRADAHGPPPFELRNGPEGQQQ